MPDNDVAVVSEHTVESKNLPVLYFFNPFSFLDSEWQGFLPPLSMFACESVLFVGLNWLRASSSQSRLLGVVPFKFFGVPSSRKWAFCEVFEVVSPRPNFHCNFVGSLPVGNEFPYLIIILISSKDEVADFEFYFDYPFVVSGSYFLF